MRVQGMLVSVAAGAAVRVSGRRASAEVRAGGAQTCVHVCVYAETFRARLSTLIIITPGRSCAVRRGRSHTGHARASAAP